MDNVENPASQTLELSNGQKLAKHGIIHFTVIMIALSLWAATDAWFLLTGLPLATFLSVVTGALAGLVATTLIHEWFHFAGARVSGSSYRIPEKTGVFVYDYNYGANSIRQFNMMSLAGQLGSVLAVLALDSMLTLDNPGRLMLVAGAIASAVFGGFIEWPVLVRAQKSHDPLAELEKINPATLGRGLFAASGGGALFYFLMA